MALVWKGSLCEAEAEALGQEPLGALLCSSAWFEVKPAALSSCKPSTRRPLLRVGCFLLPLWCFPLLGVFCCIFGLFCRLVFYVAAFVVYIVATSVFYVAGMGV